MYSEQLEFFSNGEGDFEKIQEECRRIYVELTEAFLKDPQHLIGSGNIAEVHFLPASPRFCVKIISKETVVKAVDQAYCSLSEEARFLSDAGKIKGEARVPRPYLSAVLKPEDTSIDPDDVGLQILIMERLDAVSIREVIDGLEELPEGFNLDVYFEKLRKYIERLNEDGSVYHRDLHPGNIMVGKDNEAYVIDFGSATRASNEEDSWPRNVHGQTKKIVSDTSKINLCERELRKVLGLTVQ